MDTPAPPPPPRSPSAIERAASRRERLAKPKSRKSLFLAVSGGAVALVGLVYLAIFAGSDPHHQADVEGLSSEPTGDPVPIAYAVRAGDAFETKVATTGSMWLSVKDTPGNGMTLEVHLRTRHAVSAREGGGLRSAVRATIVSKASNVPPLTSLIAEAFPTEEAGLEVSYDRDADGHPLPKTKTVEGLEGRRGLLLALVLAGLSDLMTNYLPPRPVRLGEAWDVTEAADVSTVADVLRYVAGSEGKGFPDVETKGRVRAEALESKDGEPALRLRLSVAAASEGDVVRPARTGSLSAGLEVEGDLWVSTRTGLLVASDLKAGLESTYKVDEPKHKEEYKVVEHVHTATTRATSK